jgi:UDP-N-acetylmuramoyl-tripeptide--D-alanyl-D-alanine ligase
MLFPMNDLYEKYLNCSEVTTDSRNVKKNGLFFALKGDTFNGNEFAENALESGAAFAIVDEEQFASDPRCILVDNALHALTELAKYHRAKLQCPVIAITGSNGKTTTKELLVRVLATSFQVAFTKGNLNNHIGLPLTILSADASTEILVVEMGANHQGEIAQLCEIAQPNYGMITNVGKAHLEGFGSPEVVFQTKTELYNHIMKHGEGIIVNADDKQLFEAAYPAVMMTYGTEIADVKGATKENLPFLKASWSYKGETFIQETHLFGSYNIYNVLAAVATGLAFHVDSEKIVHAIASYQPENNRSQYLTTKKNNKIILDAYNANPSSMNPALDEFFRLEGSPKYVFLGEMRELGYYSTGEHLALLQKLKKSGIEFAFLVGNEFCQFATDFPDFLFFRNSEELVEYLSVSEIKHGLMIVKGSRANALEKIVKYL